MTLSPKKYVSHFTSSTTNRGVEAKEVELANTRLDIHTSRGSGGPRPAAVAAPAPAEADDTGSYIQVEVRRARLPAASSPAPAPPPPASPVLGPRIHTEEAMEATGAGGAVLMPVLACAGANAQWRGVAGGAGDAAAADKQQYRCSEKARNFGDGNDGYDDGNDDDDSDVEARVERVEVYYFERACGAWLATSSAVAARETRVRRAARAWARRGRALLDEACALPLLASGAGVAALLAAERALLTAARDAAAGALQTAADLALKPALALLFNAALHPPLVLVGNTLRALRAALRPLWGALGDAAEPLARVLAQARLVQVNVGRRCSCPCSCASAHAV